MTKSIFSLDISKAGTGWAFGLPGDTPISGVQTFGPPEQTEDETWRAAMIWISRQIDFHKPDRVGIEAAIQSSAPGRGGFTNPHTQMLLSGLQAVMRTVVKAKLPGRAQLVNVASARKVFTGRGTYPKNEAKPVVQARCLALGWLDTFSLEENRADALCIWAFMAAQESPDFALSLNFSKARKGSPPAARAVPDIEF